MTCFSLSRTWSGVMGGVRARGRVMVRVRVRVAVMVRVRVAVMVRVMVRVRLG